jgi:L-lactate dehydrogenase complex protein LldG
MGGLVHGAHGPKSVHVVLLQEADDGDGAPEVTADE